MRAAKESHMPEKPTSPKAKDKAEPILYEFTGTGIGYLLGIPARDLTAADLEALKNRITDVDRDASGTPVEGAQTKDITVAAIEASGLYRKVS
jgi:hypothetical protein